MQAKQVKFDCTPKGIQIPTREDTGDLPFAEWFYDVEDYSVDSTDPRYSTISVRSGVQPKTPTGWVELK